MTTIIVKEDVKREFLRYAAELQLKLGHSVDYNEAIRHLLMERRKHPALLEEATRPIPGPGDAIKELMEERRRDDPDLTG